MTDTLGHHVTGGEAYKVDPRQIPGLTDAARKAWPSKRTIKKHIARARAL